MKKVLIIAYSFPPMAVVGVYRTIKFVKYLRDFGWEPVVITLKEPFDWSYNPELFKDIPQDVKIYRTRLFEPLVWWENLTAKMKHKNIQADDSGEVAVIAHSEQTVEKSKSLIKKIRGFAAAALSTPDKSLFWLATALPKAYRLIKKEKIDCIYVSTPPHSGHLIGYYLKKLTDLPFVADFRAPWTQNEYFDDYKKINFFKNIEKRMELAVHKSADAVISNSTFECEGYRRKYAPLVGDKFHPILNGYDPDDFKNLPAKTYDKFTIVYIGGLYGRRNPNLFLEGVKLFLERHPETRKDFQMMFIGINDTSLKSSMKKYDLADVIHAKGFLPQKEAFTYLLGGHLLLLILGFDERGKGVIPAKLFEYLPTGKPILALVPPNGETAKIITDNKAGIVITHPDVEKVVNALEKYYNDYRQGNLKSKTSEIAIIEQYTRRYQTKQLAEILDRVTN